ncbi:xylulokinase [Dyadobacter sandarakinus]|uniref:Carbohydrate kinase n=1 Tax=Dyadobacter sandarakinus TaxID=2747268 RepID=A0ABX7I998_9BACT|nr:FGGY family carbohydrate kinase [Dyadobacter sandarakinus]QRR02555.1 carbohydrate kinase [Dyadobacter sandarakinus]
MYLLGFDLGSSSVKACLVNADTGAVAASAFYPEREMSIAAPQPGFAEQHPELWWENACLASRAVMQKAGIAPDEVGAIGISYQMHGLVVVDEQLNVLRPSIIWCDSRAVEIGNKAMQSLGEEYVLPHLLNSPGNFTASKLGWVKEHEPKIYSRIHKFMLPGDYLAARMTGEVVTTPSGLSEGISWDFVNNRPADFLFDYFGFSSGLLAEVQPTFSEQGRISAGAALELGLRTGIPVTYRAGDQPNNAFSLNVLEPGEVAATAGTSGVVYGVSDQIKFDHQSRVNTFLHVNPLTEAARYGVLLCVNGTGSLNGWLRNSLFKGNISYPEMNALAAAAPVGSGGLLCLPFGNGAERMLENRDPGATFKNIQFSRHEAAHFTRAAQEGIVFALYYGMEIMETVGVSLNNIRAGEANMFLSPIFRETFANVSGATVELYNTDGAQGAARAAGFGLGYYKNRKEAFEGLSALKTIEPDPVLQESTREAYREWKLVLEKSLM